MEYIGKVKYIGKVEDWAVKILKNNTVYMATDLSTGGFINIDLGVEPQGFYTDIAEKFEIIEDENGLIKALYRDKM